eukprot:m.1708 g.1708  ORF g.1708 m.1708 type:complete len:61 (-) comp1313_c0_seq2:243-425(-)
MGRVGARNFIGMLIVLPTNNPPHSQSFDSTTDMAAGSFRYGQANQRNALQKDRPCATFVV